MEARQKIEAAAAMAPAMKDRTAITVVMRNRRLSVRSEASCMESIFCDRLDTALKISDVLSACSIKRGRSDKSNLGESIRSSFFHDGVREVRAWEATR